MIIKSKYAAIIILETTPNVLEYDTIRKRVMERLRIECNSKRGLQTLSALVKETNNNGGFYRDLAANYKAKTH